MSDSVKPKHETAEVVYSNFDYELNEAVEQELRQHYNEVCAQHAAWNFCGYVWFDGEVWHEEVWRYHTAVDHRTDVDLVALVSDVNDSYGSE